MALEARDDCGRPHAALARDGEAYRCVFECTFCPGAAQQHACLDCGGERVRRPRTRSAGSA